MSQAYTHRRTVHANITQKGNFIEKIQPTWICPNEFDGNEKSMHRNCQWTTHDPEELEIHASVCTVEPRKIRGPPIKSFAHQPPLSAGPKMGYGHKRPSADPGHHASPSNKKIKENLASMSLPSLLPGDENNSGMKKYSTKNDLSSVSKSESSKNVENLNLSNMLNNLVDEEPRNHSPDSSSGIGSSNTNGGIAERAYTKLYEENLILKEENKKLKQTVKELRKYERKYRVIKDVMEM